MRGWGPILLVYLVGMLAAAQLGKLAPLVGLLSRELEVSLTAAVWLTSWLEIGGATLGVVAGVAVSRLGARRSLALGSGLLLLGGAGLALSGRFEALVAARSLEAAGYLAVAIAAPSVIAQISTDAQRPSAMALWSTFVPVGLAVGVAGSGALADLVPWRQAAGANTVLCTLVVAAALLWLRGRGDAPAPAAGAKWPPLPVWLMAGGFFFYTAFEVALMVLLPTFLAERAGLSIAAAGAVTGFASVASIAGSVWAAVAMRRRRPPTEIAAIGLLVPAILVAPVFLWDLGAAGASVLAIAALAVSGMPPALVFARLPEMAGGGDRTVRGNGALAQTGASGALLGPPLCAALATGLGWESLAWALGALALASLALHWLAEERARSGSPDAHPQPVRGS
ncbi:MAG TPA: MFS transporter [Azospirillaceae bacterium]|nr:MFS transporter [Azospirillaceae bacterium]